jgi:hypothetical protein
MPYAPAHADDAVGSRVHGHERGDMTRQRVDSPPVVSAIGPHDSHAPVRRLVPAGVTPAAGHTSEEQQG